MATNYQAIIDAIDAAILTGVSGPGEVTAAGRTIRYRSLEDLTKTRQYYARLAASAAGKTGFKLTGFKTAGGQR